MATIDELTWSSLTTAVNEMKPRAAFLQNKFFTRHQVLDTETAELSTFNKARETAPFVMKNSKAIKVAGHSTKFAQVECPNLRISRDFTPSPLIFGRKPGTPIFADLATKRNAIAAHIARDLQVMRDMVANTLEVMIAQLIVNAQISYAGGEPKDKFTVTFPRAAGNTIVLAQKWDDVDPSNPMIEEDFHTAKQVISEAVGLGITDVVLGSAAATAFRKVTKFQSKQMGSPSIDIGNVTMASNFTGDGAIYLGRFCGIDVWEYPRTVSIDGAAATALIPANKAVFIADSPAAENVVYYGAIPDWDASPDTGLLATEIFAKSWEEKDPSVKTALLHSRPLPCLRRPDAMVVMQVTA